MLPTGREEGELSVTETGEASQRPSDGVLISLHGSERQKEREDLCQQRVQSQTTEGRRARRASMAGG